MKGDPLTKEVNFTPLQLGIPSTVLLNNTLCTKLVTCNIYHVILRYS